jgi:hypothetical protein
VHELDHPQNFAEELLHSGFGEGATPLDLLLKGGSIDKFLHQEKFLFDLEIVEQAGQLGMATQFAKNFGLPLKLVPRHIDKLRRVAGGQQLFNHAGGLAR